MRVSAINARLAVLAVALFVLLAAASAASAAALRGAWAPFTNCPVNTSAFVNYPVTPYGSNCVTSTSLNGTFTIRNTTIKTASTKLQFGVPGSAAANSSLGYIVPATNGRTLVAARVQVPGGLLGLMCPSGNALVHLLCNSITSSSLNAVTAKVELAGTPTNFNESGGITTGQPILTLPVKIQLQNPILGSSCYIGSHSNPIVLHPQTTGPGAVSVVSDLLPIITVTGATIGDKSFAVPGASGCGPVLLSPLVDAAVNLKQGLPSPAGDNRVVLDNATSSLVAGPGNHAVLTWDWNARCLSGC